MKLRYKLFYLILILTIGFADAQVEINGNVIVELTGEKPNDQIYVREVITKQPGTLADSLGNFRIEYLEPNKEYIIEIIVPSFETQKFKVKTSTGITTKTFVIKGGCMYDAEKALEDWKNGEAKLLLFGSIVPILNTRSDFRFEKKYEIDYFDFGCSPPGMDCLKIYNEKIFELMDKKYGLEWRTKVRKDVRYLN